MLKYQGNMFVLSTRCEKYRKKNKPLSLRTRGKTIRRELRRRETTKS